MPHYLRNISTYFNLFPCANCHFVMNANIADVTLYMDSSRGNIALKVDTGYFLSGAIILA